LAALVESDEMTREIKLIFLAAAVLGLCLGGFLGHWSAIGTVDSLESVQYIAPTKIVSDFARTQFMHADTDHARQAVMIQIRLLEQLEMADKAFHADIELGPAYSRLALIEEAAGRYDAEKQALVSARACYKRISPNAEDWTDDKLKDAVKTMDKAIDQLKGPQSGS
jgi:hypothetical protein